MDRVPGYEPGGWGFDSLRMYQIKGVDLVNYAYVTLATDEKYLFFAMYLQASLRIQKSKYPLIIMVTQNLMNDKRLEYFDKSIITPDFQFSNTRDENKKKYQDTINKFYAYTLTDYEKIIILDADLILLTNIDNIFQLKEEFVCSTYLPRFCDENIKFFPANAIMLIHPNQSTYYQIISHKDDKHYIDDENIVYYLLYPYQFQNECWDNKCNIFENVIQFDKYPIFINSQKWQRFIINVMNITPKKFETLSSDNLLDYMVAVFQNIIKVSSGFDIDSSLLLNTLTERGSLKFYESTGL